MRKTSIGFTRFLMVLILTTSAHANSVKTLTLTAPSGYENAPEIWVYSSDGETYDNVDVTRKTKVTIGLDAKCRFGKKKDKQPYRGRLILPGFQIVGRDSPPDYEIAAATTASAEFEFTTGEGQTYNPPAMCESEIRKLMANEPDKTRHQIMSEGFDIEFRAALKAQYKLMCLPTGRGRMDSKTERVLLNARVHCESSDLAASKIPSGEITVKKMELEPVITSASLAALPSAYTGKCPTVIGFKGSITSSRSGRISYKFVNEDGSESPLMDMIFEQPGSQKTRAWRRVIDGINSDTLTGDAVQPEPDSAHEWDIESWTQLEIVSPKTIKGEKANFSVDCTK